MQYYQYELKCKMQDTHVALDVLDFNAEIQG